VASGLFSGLMTLPVPEPGSYNTAADVVERLLTRLQAGLSRWIDMVEGTFFLPFTPLDEIVFTVPDIVLQLARHKLLNMLSRNSLFQLARLTTTSMSTVWYFLHNHPEILDSENATSPSTKRVNRVLVVHASDVLCEVSQFHVVHDSGVIVAKQQGNVHSEICG